jgi:hypothetical protein
LRPYRCAPAMDRNAPNRRIPIESSPLSRVVAHYVHDNFDFSFHLRVCEMVHGTAANPVIRSVSRAHAAAMGGGPTPPLNVNSFFVGRCCHVCQIPVCVKSRAADGDTVTWGPDFFRSWMSIFRLLRSFGRAQGQRNAQPEQSLLAATDWNRRALVTAVRYHGVRRYSGALIDPNQSTPIKSLN